MRILSVLLFLALATSATAQTLDCSDPQTQQHMNACAQQAWQAADEDLNLTYQLAVAMAKSVNESLPADAEKTEITLRDAQRAWITYRDKACMVEASPNSGGTIQPLIIFSCMERLTRRRTEDLRLFGEVN